MNEVLSVAQLVKLLAIPEPVIRRLVKYDEIPHQKRGGEPIFLRNEVDAWASRRILSLQEKALHAEHADGVRAKVKQAADDILMPDLLRPDWIRLGMPAKTKPGILRDMVALADETGCLYDPADLQRQVEEREALASTAMEGGIAFLHARHQDPYLISDPFMVVGVAAQPVYFGAPDGEKTDVFCLVCCGDAQPHLHTLSRLCLMARKGNLPELLRAAETPAGAYEAVVACEREVLGQL